jgi:hypothetical protein
LEDFTTHYEMLEVAEAASFEEIRTAYRRMAQEYHPDRVPEHLKKLKRDAEEKLKQINEAWAVLGNAAKRHQYDAELKEIREAEANDFECEPPTPPPPPPRQTPPPRLVISQTWFDFTGRGPSEKLEGKFTVGTTRGLLEATVKSPEPWLHVLQDQVAASASQEISFRIEGSTLQLGKMYSGAITVQSNAGNYDVGISVTLDLQKEELASYRHRMLAFGFLLGSAFGLLMYFLIPDLQTRNAIALVAGFVAFIGAIVAGAKLARWGGGIGAFFLATIAANVVPSVSMSVYSAGAWGTIFAALLVACSRGLLLEKYGRTSGVRVRVVAGSLALVAGVVAIGVYAANEIGRPTRTQQSAISSRQTSSVSSINDNSAFSGERNES